MKFLHVETLVIRAIVCLVSMSGCLWHLTDISNIYFSYETDVNVDFEREEVVNIPGVTICVNATMTVREEALVNKYPELESLVENNSSQYQNAKYFYLGKYLRNLTLYEQLNEFTYDYKQIFNSCQIMTPIAFEGFHTEDYIECDQVAPIREYITFSKKCFFIGSQLSMEDPKRYAVDHDITLRDNGFPLFKIVLNNKYLDEPMVFVQQRDTPFLGFMGGQTNGVHLNNTKYASYTLSYTKTSSYLLPPPYQTRCRDYREIGFMTLSHCIVSCKANFFITTFNGWHPDIPANDEYPLGIRYSQIKLKENKTLDKIMAEKCLQVCSKMSDCSSEYYSIQTIGQFERQTSLRQYDHLHGIYIYLPTGLNTVYTHSPRLRLIEYICYFASVFSLWFGFSIIAISKGLIKTYHYYIDRRCKSERNLYEIPVKPNNQ